MLGAYSCHTYFVGGAQVWSITRARKVLENRLKKHLNNLLLIRPNKSKKILAPMPVIDFMNLKRVETAQCKN